MSKLKFALLLGFIPVILTLIFIKLQQLYYCLTNTACVFAGSFVWFLLLNILITFVVVPIIYINSPKSDIDKIWGRVLKIGLPFVAIIYILGLRDAFLSYTRINPTNLEISNYMPDPGLKIGKTILNNADMKEVVLHWHLSGPANQTGRALFCDYLFKLVMKDGSDYSINNIQIQKYLTKNLRLPVVNTTDGRTIKCF